MVRGHYRELKILADGNTILDGGAAAFLGMLPSRNKIVAAVRDRLNP